MSLSESCAKALSDKTYEKRKLAAQEVEKMIVEFNRSKNTTQIKKLIETFAIQYCISKDPNKRKGGLIALASCAIALGPDAGGYNNELLTPVLNCLMDPDTKVRYFASESLYNIVKISRQAIIPMFPEIFSALSRLVADTDAAVKNASELLDRLMKDIITENSQIFDLPSFVPLLRERVLTKNSFARQFLISWISILNAVPEINMLHYLPEILDGIFQMLEDQAFEIQRMCETLLLQFLKNIKHDPSALNLPKMTNILILHAQNANNELIQLTALTWLREFLNISGAGMLSYSSGIFSAFLPCLAYETDSKKNIKENAMIVNNIMLDLVSSNENRSALSSLDLESVMEVLKMYLVQSSATKVNALRWIHHLFSEVPDEMSQHANNLFPVLLNILNDTSDEVVLEGLIVIADIVKSAKDNDSDFNKTKYREFLESLLKLFKEDKDFLENRGALIIKQLCALLNAEYIYRTFAEIMSKDNENLKFTSIMVRKLNTILFTSSELFELRSTLRDIKNPKSARLFECLYLCWANCPVSTISLCLLANCFEHVSTLVIHFGNLEITVDYLVEIDKLIQLIESPIFAALRLTLISKTKDSENLSNALYGILMLLPQTETFHLLKNRLQCIPVSSSSAGLEFKSIESQSGIDFNKLKEHFIKVQKNHQQKRRMSVRN
ncbi:CLUMA_CG017278, isoform A [Clunio marinus]|uniref:Protein VAC14 homolog n=1 Tax=Clunio marinus TaxID=568069 RepID=A0A1J1IWU7_9DIPT|nr:CLUMA_CG017278, isoform A [Clunio marinus]